MRRYILYIYSTTKHTLHVGIETRILEMGKFDLRYVILVIINIVKSHADPWAWDPFEVTTAFSWIKFWLLTPLSFIFGFIFIGILIPNPNNNMRFVTIQINNFSPSLLTCFLASFFTPQSLFWYLYPLILLSFFCCACISAAFTAFVFWIEATLSGVPDLNISITNTNGAGGADDHQDLEPQV